MFSILGLFLKAFVVDSVIESINLCKFFSIVTSKPTEICDFIIKDLHHSSTVVDGEGGFLPPRQESGAHRRAPGRGHPPAPAVQADRPPLLYVHHQHQRDHRQGLYLCVRKPEKIGPLPPEFENFGGLCYDREKIREGRRRDGKRQQRGILPDLSGTRDERRGRSGCWRGSPPRISSPRRPAPSSTAPARAVWCCTV